MTGTGQAFTGCDIFDGHTRISGHALLVENGLIAGIVPVAEVPVRFRQVDCSESQLLAPGFVDLQVNGGGGVMFNDLPTVETMRTIADAHLPFGTTALLPTLITDSPRHTKDAISAAREVGPDDGVIGLHLEGPHLSQSRKGAHDPDLIRPMEPADLEHLLDAAKTLPSLVITISPESVSDTHISALAKAGTIVSIGHSEATAATVTRAAQSGAKCVTHLFNAMSQLGNREPGVVGAALDSGGLSAGLIADGIHVDPMTVRIALRAKNGPGHIFLVTDAMSTIGTEQSEFQLNGRVIKRENGRLTLEDGTLAGADLDMISAVRFTVDTIGLPVEEALRMASLYPARVLGRDGTYGQFCTGARADILALDGSLGIQSVWRGGLLVSGAH